MEHTQDEVGVGQGGLYGDGEAGADAGPGLLQLDAFGPVGIGHTHGESGCREPDECCDEETFQQHRAALLWWGRWGHTGTARALVTRAVVMLAVVSAVPAITTDQ